jgi:hypothetical protein
VFPDAGECGMMGMMGSRDGGYRDELSAAHARIAELEEQVEILARRAEGLPENDTPGDVAARRQVLHERRDSLRRASRGHVWWLAPLVVSALAFAGATWLARPFTLGLVFWAGFVGVVWLMRKWRTERVQYQDRIEAVNEQIAKLPLVPEPPPVRTRLAASPESVVELAEREAVDEANASNKRTM